MASVSSFSGWLRGFLEGAGDRDLSQKQVKKIIAEAQKVLGKADEPEDEVETVAPLKAVKKAAKPKTRAELIAFARSAGQPDASRAFGPLPEVTSDEG